MTIETIGENTIKIILSESDLSNYNINYEHLNKNNTQTKKLLLDIMENVRYEKKIDLTEQKLFIEAFPQKSGGCVLYLSVVIDKDSNKITSIYTDIVCIIENIDIAVSLATRVFKNYNHLIKSSSLFYDNCLYCLKFRTFTKTKRRITDLIWEYAEILMPDEIIIAYIEEHFDEIINDNAIESLANLC